MKEGKKQRGADPMEQCDSGLIFAKVTELMSTRAINLNAMLKYELAAVPTSIFDEKSGDFEVKVHPQAKTPGGSYQSLKMYRRRCGY